MSTPSCAPSVEYVAAYLLDAAKQDASVWTVVNVVKHFLEDGLSKPKAVRAVRVAVKAAPELAGLLRLYEIGIRNVV